MAGQQPQKLCNICQTTGAVHPGVELCVMLSMKSLVTGHGKTAQGLKYWSLIQRTQV